jgi:hypothetical protein
MGWFSVDADNILRAVKEWKPGPCFNEKQCKLSLYRHLKGLKSLKTKTFHLEHPVGTGFADIFVDLDDSSDFGAKVAIELKYNLKSKPDCDRLVGQIGHYVDVGEVVVVLCGETSMAQAAIVAKRIEDFKASKLFRKGHVIIKPVTPRTKEGRFLSGAATR